jgi:PAS domain S-box-containing protein
MEKTKIIDLINFDEVNKLLEGFNQTTGFVTAILDLEGNILSKSGWRQICTQFHRINPEASKNCTISDTVLANELGNGEKYHFYKCHNGLVDVAVPIIINGEHIANLFSGQFFFEEPDRSFFKAQAQKYNFDESSYLNALDKVPIVSKEKVKAAMDFLLDMTQLISDITFQKLGQLELNDALIKSEEKYRIISDNSDDWIYWVAPDEHLRYVSPACERVTGYSPEEFVKRPELNHEIIVESDQKKVKQHHQFAISDTIPHELEYRIKTKSGELRWISHTCSPIFNEEGEFIGRRGTNRNITEHKLQEEQLYESEFRFNKLYQNGPFGMVMADREFRFKSANPTFCSILGYNCEEIINYTFKDVTHPDDLAKDVANVRKLMDQEIPVYKTEKRYVRKDGQIIWGSLTVTANYDSEGQFLYNLGIIEDITPRKHAEESLKLLNERISTATKASQVGIWDWDIRNNLLDWDEQMYALYGLNKTEFKVAYEAWLNGLHPDDRDFCHEETNRALSGEKDYDTEFRVIWPNGSTHWLKAAGQVFFDENNSPIRMVGVNYDITERKQIEKTLQESEEKFRKAFATNPDAITITRFSDGMYVSVNNGFTQIFGFTEEETIGKTPFDINMWHNPEDRKQFVAELKGKGLVENFEAKLCTKNGTLKDTLVSATLLELDGNTHILSTTKDITDRKKTENDIKELNETLERRVEERTNQLKEANQELEAFSYSVSHDLRAPLRHINGFVDLLTEKYTDLLPEKGRHYLDVIVDSSKQMAALIDDLLQFSRTGRKEMQETNLDMNQVLQEAIGQMNPDIETRKIEWDIAQLPTIQGDHSLLRMVWQNLLSNAIKFTKEKEKAHIQIGCTYDEYEFTFFVRDNGAGFDMRFANKLFGVFQRLHTAKEFEGTGIGLANVRRIILKHGGRTWAESQINEGATFYFTLPKH